MIFQELIKSSFDAYSNFERAEMEPSTITVYPLTEYNLEGVKLLFDNCKKAGAQNNNSRIATVDPVLWLGEFLDKNFDKISYVSTKLEFTILKIEKDKIINKRFHIRSKEFYSDNELNNFFNDNKFKTLVVFSIIKQVDLNNLQITYKLRYSDITENSEIRDKKIKELFKPDN